jgi:uncharacterized protein (DUF2235 family)
MRAVVALKIPASDHGIAVHFEGVVFTAPQAGWLEPTLGLSSSRMASMGEPAAMVP